MKTKIYLLVIGILFIKCTPEDHFNELAIQPYKSNPRFWQYKNQPIMLLGGTKDDNLYQIPNLEEHLNLLVSVGGNYIRNTMSSRDSGNVYPYAKVDGKYNLNIWNEDYWNRLENLLKLTQERDIIVQLEVWAQWDFIRRYWKDNPYNPANNINYTFENSTLKDNYDSVTWKDCEYQHDFFLSVPSLANDTIILSYQKKFVDKLLEYTFQYPNVLYTMTNEIFNQYPPDWGWYWADYIKEKAEDANKNIFVTEMFQNHDIINGINHKYSLDHPEIYTYVELSQNAANKGQQHWDNIRHIYEYISDAPRPINHVKTYGGIRSVEETKNGLERFWRSLLGGAASIRFHRPSSGIGLNELAQKSLLSARLIEKDVNFWDLHPKMELLEAREDNEAYLTCVEGEKYVIYFPSEAEVEINLKAQARDYTLKWIDIKKGEYMTQADLTGGNNIKLTTPYLSSWIALITKK